MIKSVYCIRIPCVLYYSVVSSSLHTTPYYDRMSNYPWTPKEAELDLSMSICPQY